MKKKSSLKRLSPIQVFEYGQAVTSQRELESLINKTYSSPELRSYLEAQIISALQSEKTTLAAKTFFCQKLASISSEASLPILGQMLLQDETTQMACIALKSHPSPQANHYLRKALDGLEGMSKVAVINLIGERRDADSIEILRFLTSDDDLNTVKAAISALGNIGDSKCAKILKDLRASNKTDLKFVLADAYLQCAMSLKKENKISDAAKMLQELCQKNVPTVIRQGARNNLLDLGLLDINFDEIQAVSLFDGASFEGWNGNLKYFRIEDEAIVAGTMDEPIPRNEFLCTDCEYINFELRLKCKLSAKEINGGIQIRSLRVPNSHEMWGYQADMGQNYWGSLYDESRRKVTLVDSNKWNWQKSFTRRIGTIM